MRDLVRRHKEYQPHEVERCERARVRLKRQLLLRLNGLVNQWFFSDLRLVELSVAVGVLDPFREINTCRVKLFPVHFLDLLGFNAVVLNAVLCERDSVKSKNESCHAYLLLEVLISVTELINEDFHIFIRLSVIELQLHLTALEGTTLPPIALYT